MNNAVDDASNDADSAVRFSCFACRSRKMKCDRGRPVCTRCLKAGVGDGCEYPSSRKRPVIVASRPRVKELAARLVDLEQRLETEKRQNAKSQGSSSVSGTASSPDVMDLVDTGRLEQLPPPFLVDELTNIFFTLAQGETAMLHQSRYIASLYLPPHMQPPMCLQYALMAIAAGVSTNYSQLAEPFYRRSRQYIEAEEMKGDGQGIITVAHAQAWILLNRFETQHMWWSRAAMSCSKAVRLAQVLGLDTLDKKTEQSQALPPARDWCEKEERRRTFWAIFFCDRGASSTAGWPILMDYRRIHTLLPTSDEAFSVGIEETAITLRQALQNDQLQYSTYASQILAVHLFHQCLDLSKNNFLDEDDFESEDEAFWAQYQELDTALSAAFLNLPEHLRYNVHDSHAMLANLRFHTAAICLHRAGVARMKRRDRPGPALIDSQSRLFLAAEEIFSIVAVIGDIHIQFRNPFVSFAAFMAASVFIADYANTQNKQSDERFDALMDLMVAAADSSRMTASLAVQLAHQSLRTGTDPNALNKVRHLMAAMDPNVPLMAKQDDATGRVLFCPIKVQTDPSKVFINMHAEAQMSPLNF